MITWGVDGTWHLPRPIQSIGRKMGTGVSDPVLSSCRVRDVDSDVLFCCLVLVYVFPRGS